MPKAAHSLPLFRGTNNRKLMGWVKKREISHCQKQLRLYMGKINLKYYYQIFYSNPFLTHPLPTSLGNNKKKINSFLGAYAQLHAWSRNLCQNGYFQNTFLHLQDTLKTKEKEISDCKFFCPFLCTPLKWRQNDILTEGFLLSYLLISDLCYNTISYCGFSRTS